VKVRSITYDAWTLWVSSNRIILNTDGIFTVTIIPAILASVYLTFWIFWLLLILHFSAILNSVHLTFSMISPSKHQYLVNWKLKLLMVNDAWRLRVSWNKIYHNCTFWRTQMTRYVTNKIANYSLKLFSRYLVQWYR